MSAVTRDVNPPSGFSLSQPQTLYYAGDNDDDAASKRPKRSASPKSTGSAAGLTSTPVSSSPTVTTSPQTSHSSMRCSGAHGSGGGGGGGASLEEDQSDQVEMSEEGDEEEREWRPYSGDRYVRADIRSADVEKALEGGDYVIIEEEVLEEVFVQEPGEKPNVVRRIRRRVLKSKSKKDLRLDPVESEASAVVEIENPPKETKLNKNTESELLDVANIGSNKDSGIDCGAHPSPLSEFSGGRASYQDEAHCTANTTILSSNESDGTFAGSIATNAAPTTMTSTGTTTDLEVPDGEQRVRSNSVQREGVERASSGEAKRDHSDGGGGGVQPPIGRDRSQVTRSLTTSADEGDSDDVGTQRADALVKKSPASEGVEDFGPWKVVQQRNSGADSSSGRHQPRRFQDPYQLDRHAVWYGDKYKWMTGVPLPAWVMELRISDESAFTECMEHFQAFGRWPSDAELGPCPAAIPAAGGGFMHNPAAPLPTFVKLTRDRHLLNQYFAHFRVFGRWPRVS